MYSFVWLPSLSNIILRFICVVMYVTKFILLLCWIVFHCMDLTPFVNPVGGHWGDVSHLELLQINLL